MGDRVLLVSENRPEWCIADLAVMTAGGITVPAYTTNTVDDKDPDGTRELLVAEAAKPGIDGMLALNNSVAEIAAASVPRRVVLGSFDFSPGVLAAVRTGRIEFAVDQQPYLQGYLPIVFLTELARYGLFPAQGDVIPTGPNFVTSRTAEQAERLSEQGIR